MNDLRDSAFALREAQRAYMADRGNEAKGKAVAAAAERLDAALAVPVVVGRDAVSELIEAARQVAEAPPLSAVEIAAMARLIRATDAAVTALSAAQPEGGEAVAWRVRIADGTSFLTVNRDIVDKWEGATWEPLYTRPAPAQQAVTGDERQKWQDWLEHAVKHWPEAETALLATASAMGPSADITEADIVWAEAALTSTAAKAAEGAK